MLITKDKDLIIIDFKNDILYGYNDVGIDIQNDDIDQKILIKKFTYDWGIWSLTIEFC